MAAWALISAARFIGPSDLLDNDQVRPAAYALDVLVNGHWLVQRDPTGDIASKPPLYTWLVALIAATGVGVNEWSLYAPTSAAVLFITIAVLRAGTSRFGAPAGLLAAGAFLFSMYAAKHMALARTDALFAALVTAAALTAYRARTSHAPGLWIVFWLLAAAATLTKGPLALPLAAAGLLTLRSGSEQRDGSGRRAVLAAHFAGAALYLTLCGGWLLAAWLQQGQPVLDKLIGRELIGHAAASDSGGWPLISFYKPPLYFLSRFAPWSIPTCVALWRVFKQPESDPDRRLFERFLAGWFLIGLAIFSIAPHQRPDLLLPLIPAAALLAGREMSRWLPTARRSALLAFTLIGVIAAVAVMFERRAKANDPIVKLTAEWKDLAHRIRAAPSQAALIDVDGPIALQVLLGVHQARETNELAAEALRAAPLVIVAKRTRAGEASGMPGILIASLPDPTRPHEWTIEVRSNDPHLLDRGPETEK